MTKRTKPPMRANQFPYVQRKNEDLIRDAIEIFKLTKHDEVFDLLVRHAQNFEAIADSLIRSKAYKDEGLDEPSNDVRAVACLTNAKDGSTARNLDWARCVKNDTLIDQNGYHKVTATRLKEQIRKSRGQCERSALRAATAQNYAEQSGQCGAIHHSEIEPDPLPRISTGIESLDKIFGTTRGYTEDDGSIVPEQHGMVRGFVYCLGAREGVGKTRLMVSLMKNVCNSVTSKSWYDGPNSIVGGCKGLYLQAETTRQQFTAIFTSKIWDRDTNVLLSGDKLLAKHFELIAEHKPDFVVIDSKDMVHEFSKTNLFRRAMEDYKDMAIKYNFALIIISHLTKGKNAVIKGSADVAYLVDATMYAEPVPHTSGVFGVYFGKNRAGRTGIPVNFKHGEFGVEPWKQGELATESNPELSLLGDLIDQFDPRNDKDEDV